MAILEGSSSADTMALAKCGNFGQNPGSARRDLVSHFCKDIKVCDPMPVTVDVLDPNTRKHTKEAKAAETKKLLPCLSQVLREALPEDDPIHQAMLACLEALIQIADLYDAIELFPTSEEFLQAANLAKRFFSNYHDLNQWALLKGRKLFHITHKFHSFHHLTLNSKYLNYITHPNYRAEHFVGRISVLTHSTAFGVKSSKLSSKLAVKYKFLLHLQLSRPGFGQEGQAS